MGEVEIILLTILRMLSGVGRPFLNKSSCENGSYVLIV